MFENLALSENGFLFDTQTGSTYSVSRTGTFILRALMGGASVGTIASQVSRAFDIDPHTAQRDAEQFLLRLRDLQLVSAEG